jgi:plasmid maintenance system antidote protein VapI
MLRRNGRHLAEATRRLSRTFATGLSAEGASHRQIARRLNVTHQRVSAILNGQRRH